MTVIPMRRPDEDPHDPVRSFDPVETARQDASEAVAYSYELATNAGLRLPWPAIDRMVGTPLLPGWFALVGGRAKAGKSAFLRALFHAWTSLGQRVMYVGTEQAAFLLRMMWAAERLQLPMAAVLDPMHPDHPALLADLATAQVDMAERAVIVAEADLSVDRFIHWCRVAYRLKCRAVLLDHFHRLSRTSGPVDSPWASRGDNARQIKNAAERSGMLLVAAAQMKHGEGGHLLGEFDVPGPGSWAETADLRREADVAIQLWKPFRSGVTAKMKREAKDDPAKVAGLVQSQTVAARTDAHRYNGEAEASKWARLRITSGLLETWTPRPGEESQIAMGV